jgi:hypothetical protein
VKVAGKIVIGLALVVALAFPANAAPAKAKTACSLLTTSEIKAQFGPDVGRGTKGIGPGCDWEVGTEPGVTGSGAVATFLLRVQAKASFAAGRQTEPSAETVRGLGKDAYYAPGTGTLWVLKNPKTTFFVQGVFVGENVGRDEGAVPDLEGKLTTLAKKALKRA